jgi:Glycosyl hydrolase family 3 C-terminal domain
MTSGWNIGELPGLPAAADRCWEFNSVGPHWLCRPKSLPMTRSLCVKALTTNTHGEGMDLAFKFEDQGLAGLGKAIILPEFQDELIRHPIERNPKTIVVLHGTGNFDIQNWINQVPGLLHAWYPGENGGQALAEILFGDVNPSGKLPITMEKRLADNPTTANIPPLLMRSRFVTPKAFSWAIEGTKRIAFNRNIRLVMDCRIRSSAIPI